MTKENPAPIDRAGWIGALGSAGWCLAFWLGTRAGSPLAGLGLAALVVVLVAALRPRWRPHVAVRGRDLGWGIAVGAVTLAGTYGLYPVLRELMPQLGDEVRAFQDLARVTPLTLPVVCLVVVAEELWWRGAWLAAWQDKHGALVAVISTTTLYAGAQLGAGIPVLGAVALGLGALWALEAVLTQSVAASVVSHLLWTLCVSWIAPLER